MEEIIKHINNTNASYRSLNSKDAKNTDLFLDSEHYQFFDKCKDEKITVILHKENLAQAILFIASILPRKFDLSSKHFSVSYSKEFVLDQLSLLDSLFVLNGEAVSEITQTWDIRKDVTKKNGKIDKRLYFKGFMQNVKYKNHLGQDCEGKFSIRNYLAGGYSNLHIIKTDKDDVFDINIENALIYHNDGKEDELENTNTDSELELQQIFYGAPGSGKSTAVKNKIAQNKMKLFRTTFHPESDYFSFFGSYKPSTEKTTGKIIYKFTPQIFLKSYLYAWQHPEEKVCLDIEEINRGNCAQIFGDIFQLLDRKDSGFSTYIVDADEDCGIFIKNEFDKLKDATGNNPIAEKYKEKVCSEGNISKEEFVFSKLLLPDNLYIFATMNTSDQSLYPMDSAFKRRWAWKYVPIDYDKVKDKFVTISGTKYSWTDFLLKVNKRIESITQSEDKKLGQYFIGQNKDEITEEEFRDKVLFYLWNDIFKDEVGTGTTIFKTFNSADNSKVECFSFSDLFNREASVLIEDIMKNLAVKVFSKNENSTEQADKVSSEENTDTPSVENQQEDRSEQQS